MSRVFGLVGFFIYIIVGVYLLNYPFQIISLPGFIDAIDRWLIFIGGILVIIGGIKYLFSSRHETIAI